MMASMKWSYGLRFFLGRIKETACTAVVKSVSSCEAHAPAPDPMSKGSSHNGFRNNHACKGRGLSASSSILGHHEGVSILFFCMHPHAAYSYDGRGIVRQPRVGCSGGGKGGGGGGGGSGQWMHAPTQGMNSAGRQPQGPTMRLYSQIHRTHRPGRRPHHWHRWRTILSY